MVLSDADILKELKAGRIIIEPLDSSALPDDAVQPASVDLRLGRKLRVFKQHTQGFIDVKQEMPHLTEMVEIDEVTPFYLHPGEFALGVTWERVGLPTDIVGRLDGKSSLGRLGLVVHSTAGFVDPGWQGCLTLELSNLSPLPITLYYGMKVSQISFMRLTSPAHHAYGSKKLGSKYQGQDEPVPSRYYLNYRRPKG
ncbi:MAG: dCTP deaminase [Chloroflexi bacterium]|nr:dCTP deaminase [Chloroflexota bacterium]